MNYDLIGEKKNEIFLFYSWMRLRMLVDPVGKVPVKVVARTFASGKTEKLVYQCLADLKLPSEKVRCGRLRKKLFFFSHDFDEVKK